MSCLCNCFNEIIYLYDILIFCNWKKKKWNESGKGQDEVSLIIVFNGWFHTIRLLASRIVLYIFN